MRSHWLRFQQLWQGFLLVVVVPCAAAQEPLLPASPPPGVVEVIIGERRTVVVPNIRRLLIGNADLFTASQVDANTLSLIGLTPGRTFLHVWSEAGRVTIPVQVLYPRPVRVEAEREAALAQAIEHASPLALRYEFEYEFSGRDQSLSRIDRLTTNRTRHRISHEMETPFGMTSSQVAFSRTNALADLAGWYARLSDGHVGPVHHLDAVAGDTGVPFGEGSFAIPPLGFRGASMTYKGLSPWTTSAVWGQERFGVLTSLSSEAAAEQDAFLYGFHVAHDDRTQPWSSRLSALFGYGDDRAAGQSNHVFSLGSTVRPVEPLTIDTDVATSEGKFGYTLRSSYALRRGKVGLRYRDISESFQGISGSVGGQGQRGVLMDGSWKATDRLGFQGRFEIFRDRLFPNPDELTALNTDLNTSFDWQPLDGTGLFGYFNRRRRMGSIFPSDELYTGISASQRLPLDRLLPRLSAPTLSALVEHQDTRNVTSPTADFDSELLSLNLSMPLAWGLSASVGKQWRFLEQTATGDRSRPSRFTVSLAHGTSFDHGRWSLRGRFGYENEEQTGAIGSFLAGQDRLGWDAGLRYHPSRDTEVFVDGRIEHVSFEGSRESQVELSVFSGVRLLFNTEVVRLDPWVRIGGMVFHDINGDGQLQPGEEGLEHIKVMAGPSKTAITGADGRFTFGRVFGKTVPVRVDVSTLPKGYVMSTPVVQRLRANQVRVPLILFGALGRAELRGRIFYDVDGNGAYSAADRGIPQVRVQIDGKTSETDRSGWFSFRDLGSGRYTLSLVLESLPLRYLPTVPIRQVFELTEGGVATMDIPVIIRRAIQGRVFVDRDQSRRFEVTDLPLRGVPMCLDGRRVATTGADGIYRFSDVGLGDHALLLNCGMPLKGLRSIEDSERAVMISTDDPELITVDFRLGQAELPSEAAPPAQDTERQRDGRLLESVTEL
ncbi:MAG: pilus assembly protein N-terminal domain-containing protein [Candidatus Omnitrophica bacterium]|nr:pilus assembly protein N-terminal domain-containing protein [Candidatus Omnitrophota bacterium]